MMKIINIQFWPFSFKQKSVILTIHAIKLRNIFYTIFRSGYFHERIWTTAFDETCAETITGYF